MIKINLQKGTNIKKGDGSAPADPFGGEEFKEVASTATQRQGLIRLIIILIGPLALYAFENQIIPEKNNTLKTKQAHFAEVQAKNEKAKGAVEEIKKFKQDQTRLQQQINTIDRLSKDRLKFVKILDQIQRDIPEKVWLTHLENKNDILALSGSTVADTEMTAFMDKLSSSVFFQDVKLKKSTNESVDSVAVTRFDIECSLHDLNQKSDDSNSAGAR